MQRSWLWWVVLLEIVVLLVVFGLLWASDPSRMEMPGLALRTTHSKWVYVPGYALDCLQIPMRDANQTFCTFTLADAPLEMQIVFTKKAESYVMMKL